MASDSKDAVLAKPPGDCCLQGSIHKGEPQGTYEEIAGVKTYIARPAEDRANGNIILYFPDVWGLFQNGLLIMDGFAAAGYLVLGLDYFRGDPITKHRKNRHDTSNPNFDFPAWTKMHMEFADKAVPPWIAEVKAQYGKDQTKYACVGYCFGAPYVCNELAGDTVTVGAFGHPAFLNEHHFFNLKKPLFLSCTNVDHTFSNEDRRRALDIMQAEKKTHQLQLFTDIAHGFALRGDLNNPYDRE
ncbi:hypothetical protein B7494_g7467 [Chlorociboria aeruginascens]|nr:hypothetical protein B7494_g7467 [Chlorociboria aeruginascens]